MNHSDGAVTLLVMTLLSVLALGLVALGKPISVTEPVYPIGVLAGGIVVAELHTSAGAVAQVEILAGKEPFAVSARDALRTWRFDPRSGAERISVVLNFQNPNLFALGSRVHDPPSFRKSYRPSDLAWPEQLVEPVYPANVLGQGSVILRLEIDDGGAVSIGNVITSLGGLTDPCTKAVEAWKFVPARDRSGRPTRSQVFAVCVFRHPVL